MQNTLPEKADCRRKKRLRSGVYASAVTAGVLLLLFLLYCFAGKILQNIAESRWEKVITAAISSGDAEKTAELLEKCRREAPYLQKKNLYRQWQKEYLRLVEIQKFRRQEFYKRLNALQKKLKTPPEKNFSWTDALTSLASYASNSQELARVRELEAHCMALEKLRKLKTAAAGVKAVESLQKNIDALQILSQQKKWAELQKNCRNIEKQIAETILKYASLPEIGGKAMQMKKVLEQLQNSAGAAQAQAEAEKQLYRQLFMATSEKALHSAIRDFLKRYPDSGYADGLENTLKELQLLQHTYREQLDFIVQSMKKNKQNARSAYQRELAKLIAQELEFGTFELILHTDSNRIVRFETMTKCSFTLQKNNQYTISFTDINGNKISGVFDADGKGWVTDSRSRLHGRLAYGKVAGALPESVKQHVLLKLQQLMQRYKDEDFPVFLYFIGEKMNSGKFNLLPAGVKEKLQTARITAEKHLQASALQFLFTEEIIRNCRDNTPVFAGIVKAESGKLHFTPSAAALACNRRATLWLVNSRKSNPFEASGKLENSGITPGKENLPDGKKIYIAAIPANGADFTELLKKWQKTASQNQLEMPTLPNFLKK
ncbi:MAG: hypothetical protein E7039_10610 [Lentisphaerae bacterium]|nr:hypothetical protein [Lentisphaerota bacterium]